MAQKYQEKKETGHEFVDAATNLATLTAKRCMRLPHRWDNAYCTPLMQSGFRYEELVIKGNSVYTNERDLPHDEYVANMRKAFAYYEDALHELANYYAKLDRLLDNIDFTRSEVTRIKRIIEGIVDLEQSERPESERVDIYVHMDLDKITYTSNAGEQCVRLKLTRKNKKEWLHAYTDAQCRLKAKVSSMRRKIKEISEKDEEAQVEQPQEKQENALDGATADMVLSTET